MIHGRMVPFAFWHPVTFCLSDPHRRFDVGEMLAVQAVLEDRGQLADYQSVTHLTGVHIRSRPGRCVPANDHAPYGTGRYWKIDGVAPEVKEAAKRAAHQVGEGVGLWLDGLLRKHLNLPIMAKDSMISTNL